MCIDAISTSLRELQHELEDIEDAEGQLGDREPGEGFLSWLKFSRFDGNSSWF